MAVRINVASRRTMQYGCTIRRDHVVIGHGSLTVACVTVGADGGMASTALPQGLLDRLQGVMTESTSDRTTDP